MLASDQIAFMFLRLAVNRGFNLILAQHQSVLQPCIHDVVFFFLFFLAAYLFPPLPFLLLSFLLLSFFFKKKNPCLVVSFNSSCCRLLSLANWILRCCGFLSTARPTSGKRRR